MASIEFIQKRIEGKQKEIAKLNSKLARIYSAQATGWEKNPYWYSESDINYTLKEIAAAEKQLEAYQIQLNAEEEKKASRNVQVILDFLEDWKARVRSYYIAGFEEYYEDVQRVAGLRDALNRLESTPAENRDYAEYITVQNEYSAAKEDFNVACKGKYENIPKTDLSYRRWFNEKKKVATGKYEWLKDYFQFRDQKDAEVALDKLLTSIAELKYDDIISRTNSIVGEIEDASALSIGLKGDLNGIIKGTRGTASVNTIGAGGYNIQIYHFRTLIKEIKA